MCKKKQLEKGLNPIADTDMALKGVVMLINVKKKSLLDVEAG